jgi:hypothetical protein
MVLPRVISRGEESERISGGVVLGDILALSVDECARPEL